MDDGGCWRDPRGIPLCRFQQDRRPVPHGPAVGQSACEGQADPAKYQAITRDSIPEVSFDGGRARIIAGDYSGTSGPASTFTPINLWDVRLDAGADVTLPLPAGHTTMVAVLSGHVTLDGQGVGEAEIARLSSDGEGVQIKADGDAMILVLTGEPIDEPVFGHGPFVMNTEAEIRQAIAEFNSGKFGALASA